MNNVTYVVKTCKSNQHWNYSKISKVFNKRSDAENYIKNNIKPNQHCYIEILKGG